MVLGAAGAAAAAAAGGELFSYNRENFLYDRKLRQETEYNIMDFRMKQADLWREDVSDMIGLTSVKMDTYLIVNAVELGFCVMAFCEGRIAAGTPVWLIGCHTLSLAGAFMYLLMSVWLAMHASVTSKSYEVRLLTQLVRLPVPSWTQLEGARTYASSFEKIQAKQMFRVPFATGTQETVLGKEGSMVGRNPEVHAQNKGPRVQRALTMSSDVKEGGEHGERQQTADVWGLERRGEHIYELDGTKRLEIKDMRHVRLVRHAMQYWQSYDGFSRAAMSVGTNQLVTAMSYYVIAYVLVSHHAVVAAWLVVIVFQVIACALIRLDMSLTAWEYKVSVVLIITGPVVNAVAAEEWSKHTVRGMSWVNLLTPLAYLAHALWLTFLLHSSNVRVQRGGALLPTGFRSVMFIDVFGWIKQQSKKARRLKPWDSASSAVMTVPEKQSSNRAGAENCAGPAVSATGHSWGEPMAMRPEDIPGASMPPLQLDQIKAEDLEPTTFVPKEKDEEDLPSPDTSMAPGFVPWRIFCAATTLLIVLWWLSGGLVLLLACGIQPLKVDPLRRPPKHHEAMLVDIGVPVDSEPHWQHSVGDKDPQILAETLVGGQQLTTSWPHTLERPSRLACSPKDPKAGRSVVAMSRFDIYAAQLPGDGSERSLAFVEAPPCAPIEGQSLLDVTLNCGGPNGHCVALVLHQDSGGERLSACNISKEAAESFRMESSSSPFLSASRMNVADSHPEDVASSSQEEATSISLAEQCQDGSGRCAFVGTNSRRVLEVRMGTTDFGQGEPDWFPTRLLRSVPWSGTDESAGSQHMGISLIDHLHLGVLRPDENWLDVLDSKNGELVGRWQLPKDMRWVSACSAQANLYVLASGRDPQVWQFPLPEILRTAAKGDIVAAETAAKGGHKLGRQRQRANQAFLIAN